MKVTSAFIVSMICLVIFFPLAARPQSRDESEAAFPMSKGTKWTYEGPVKWTKSGSTEVFSKTLTWKMEILDEIQREGIAAAVLKGFPGDLWFYEEDRQPGFYLIIRVLPGRYYLLPRDAAKKAQERLQDRNDNLQGLVKETDLIFDSPLIPGKRFGETEMITRADGLYSWLVEDQHPAKLDGVKGVTPSQDMTEYTLTSRALTDHTFVGFVPKIGITSYTGAHHGTISEMDMKLVEFNPAK